MKTMHIILALAAPAMIAAGYVPENANDYNALNINNIQMPRSVFSDDDGYDEDEDDEYDE